MLLWLGACGIKEERRYADRPLVEKPEGKGPLGRPWRRQEDNI
jgi:hypothetical protein